MSGTPTGQFRVGATVDSLISTENAHPRILRDQVRSGDWVILRTLKSEYRLRVLDDGRVEARGGWFDKKGYAPMVIGVTGATWGGSAVMPGVFAACGMRVEFRNRLITSPVLSITIIPSVLVN